MMKNFFKIPNQGFFLFGLCFFLTSTSAHAGREIGNGGHSIVCQQQNGNPTYELYDLFESTQVRIPRLAIIKDANTPFMDQVETGVQKIEKVSPLYGRVVREEMKEILSHINFVENQELTFIPDGGLLSRPVNCSIEQLANYSNNLDYQLLISKERFDRLPPTDQAALILHETIYKLDRQVYATDSIAARKLVGYIFSSQLIPVELIQERALFYVDQVINQGPFIFSRLQKVFKNLSTQTVTTLEDVSGDWELWGKAPQGNDGRARFLFRGRRYTRYFQVNRPLFLHSPIYQLKVFDKVLDEGLNFVNMDVFTKDVVQKGNLVVFSNNRPEAGDYSYKCLVHKERIFVQEEDVLFCEQYQFQKTPQNTLNEKLLQYILLNRPSERI